MRFLRIIAVAAVLLPFGLAAVAAAQSPAEPTPSLLRQFTYQGKQSPMRFKIVAGRVELDCRITGGYSRRNGILGGTKETMEIVGDNSKPKLTYAYTSAASELKIDVVNGGDDMTIRRSPRGKETKPPVVAVEFRQTAGKDVSLTVGAGDQKQVYRAADLWRLLIAHPKECRQHLIPLLSMLRPDWNVAAMADGVETRLLALADEEVKTKSKTAPSPWAPLVEQLGDDSFAKREEADRALRAGGPSTLAYLRQLDFAHLDAEQQFRVRRIIDALGGKSEDDSADEAAVSLVRDPAVWLALLERPETAKRQTAAGQLAALLGHPIDVDPATEPDTQKAKRDALRAKIERK